MMETLQDYGIYVRSGATGNVKTTCPQCSSQRKKKKDPCLSVNVDDGCWRCHNCEWTGGLKKEKEPEAETMQKPKKQRKKNDVNPQPLTDDALKWLSDRGLSKETAEAFNV